MSDIIIQQNNDAIVPPEFPTNVQEQAPVLIQENILQDGGIAATVEVASTTTLDPDTPAYVNNIGDEKHAVLQFGIPKGETGDAGIDGVDGEAATIVVGSTTTVDPDEPAVVVNSGTSQNAVLDFSIPQGIQGEQGEQGISPRAYVEQTATGAMIHIDDFMTETNVEVLNGQDGADGQAATVSVGSTTTGAAGTNASVVNSGTSSAAVLDFTIPRGADGTDGVDGVDGVDGFSPIATVSQTQSGATITITDAQGTTTANISNGTDGQAGQAATITVGSTTTGAAGTNASVVNSGTSSAAVFDFTIPRGADGADGSDGADGQAATITVGSTTTGAAGTNASVVNSGTSSAAVLDFTIPQGAPGVAGADGADGQAATITVGSTTTGAAGTNASVVNSGTSSAAILDFVIPRGADGQTPSLTDRPVFKALTNWQRTWTVHFDDLKPQIFFIAWGYNSLVLARLFDGDSSHNRVLELAKKGGGTYTTSTNITNHTFTITLDNTGICSYIELSSSLTT